MKERPIIFSGVDVLGILDGLKTQTRRVVTFRKYPDYTVRMIQPQAAGVGESYWVDPSDPVGGGEVRRCCPLGEPGDRLWVRETWAAWTDTTSHSCVVYRSDMDARAMLCGDGGEGDPIGIGGVVTPITPDLILWRSSTTMPRWASRITLEVVDVRVERVQEIGVADAIAEGIKEPRRKVRAHDPITGVRMEFRSLWNTTNAARGYGWDANPLVWVVEFRPVKP